jgi:hypothetical protein
MAPVVGIEASEAIALALLSHVLGQAEEVPVRRTGTRRSNGHSPSSPVSRA